MKYVNSHSGFAVMVKVGHFGSVFIVISPNCIHGIAVHRCGLLLQMFRGFSVSVSVWASNSSDAAYHQITLNTCAVKMNKGKALCTVFCYATEMYSHTSCQFLQHTL